MAGLFAVAAAATAYGYRRGWHLWAWERRLPAAIIGTPLLAIAIFVGYELGSPLFTNVTIEEEFPFAFSAVIPDDMKMDDVEKIMAGMAKVDQMVEESMPASMPITAGSPTPTTTSASTPASTGVARLKAGEFRDQDGFHKGSGTATIYIGPDGSHLLRLENLKVTNGPDLDVILSPHQNPKNRSSVKTAGYVDLGKLKGNQGNQNYPIPADVDVATQGAW